jgi:hypothetical protein
MTEPAGAATSTGTVSLSAADHEAIVEDTLALQNKLLEMSALLEKSRMQNEAVAKGNAILRVTANAIGAGGVAAVVNAATAAAPAGPPANAATSAAGAAPSPKR